MRAEVGMVPGQAIRYGNVGKAAATWGGEDEVAPKPTV
jgi:hypothetical protein